jgi:DNA polymerase-1
MLWKLMQDSRKSAGPTHIACVFDYSEKTFRNEIYQDYKAHRPPMPEELIPQFRVIRDAVKAFNIACIEQEGFEADDLIATYARQSLAAGGDVTIVSSDKDLMQLIGPGLRMLDTMKTPARTIGTDEVREKFGVPPDKVVDVQALAGDSTDNVPGVPGIGVKTAAELINEYGDLDTLLAHAGEIKQAKRRERLMEFALQAKLSRELVRLKQDVPVIVPVEQLGLRDPNPDELLGFLREMEFTSLTKRIAEGLGVSAPPPVERGGPSLSVASQSRVAAAAGTDSTAPALAPQAAVRAASAAAKAEKIDRSVYETVTSLERLDAWIAEAFASGRCAFDTETTSLDPMRAEFVGFSMAIAPGRACYVPLGHRPASGTLDFSTEPLTQVPVREALQSLKPLLEDPSVLKIGQNLKYDCVVLAQHGIRVAPLEDTMLLSYALDAGRGAHGLDGLAERHLGHSCMPFTQVLDYAPGARKSDKTFAQVPLDKATEYSGEDADVTLRLWMVL